jgi:hypothetical protein
MDEVDGVDVVDAVDGKSGVHRVHLVHKVHVIHQILQLAGFGLAIFANGGAMSGAPSYPRTSPNSPCSQR